MLSHIKGLRGQDKQKAAACSCHVFQEMLVSRLGIAGRLINRATAKLHPPVQTHGPLLQVSFWEPYAIHTGLQPLASHSGQQRPISHANVQIFAAYYSE